MIAGFWEAERKGADEEFTTSSDVVAVGGATAVVRAHGMTRSGTA